MKLNFDYLHRVADQLHEAYMEDGGEQAYVEGRHVFSIGICPEAAEVEVHVAWPMFKQLVANEGDEPAKSYRISGQSRALYWTCKVQGVMLRAVLYHYVIVEELKALELPVDTADDIENLLILWQNATGWNLGWEAESNG